MALIERKHFSPYVTKRFNDVILWRVWNENTLRAAQKDNKPLLLHIGYSTCHWCHLFGYESLEDAMVGVFINRYFVPVVIDRNLRPDIASNYMNAAAVLVAKSGWPLNAFLTPEGKPFYAVTYAPPEERYGEESFVDVMRTALGAWEDQRPLVNRTADEMAEYLRDGLTPLVNTYADYIGTDPTPAALEKFAQSYDPEHGGFDANIKFPEGIALQWLLMLAERGDEQAREMALTTLDAMARGGIYDILGGGFHAYTQEPDWEAPRYEKQLTVNSEMALAYLRAFRLTGKEEYRRVAKSTLDFILNTLRLENGLFSPAQDGDTNPKNGTEGRYFSWTEAEVRAALDEMHANALLAAFPLGEEPKPLRQKHSMAEAARTLGISPAEAERLVNEALESLRAARARRKAPFVDIMAITAWNALASEALAQAAQTLDEEQYLSAASETMDRLMELHAREGHLPRAAKNDETRGLGFLEDYAAVGRALLALAKAEGNAERVRQAEQIAAEMDNLFADEWGYYDSAEEHKTPLARPKELIDSAQPSGNSWAAAFLLELAQANGSSAARDRAAEAMRRVAPLLARYPTGLPQWLILHTTLAEKGF